MRNLIKKILILGVALLMILALVWNITFAHADNSNKEKYPLYFNMDITMAIKDPNKRWHESIGKSGYLDAKYDEMWKNLPITVIDSKGQRRMVDKATDSYRRYAGKYEDGEELRVEIDYSKLVEGLHISKMRQFPHKYIYDKGVGFYTYKINNSKDKDEIRVSIGMEKIKFDLQGGNINGHQEPVINIVKRDNSVAFPQMVKKEKLHFKYWYTRATDNRAYAWDESSRFSDYSNDWIEYNDPAIDPVNDGIFLLRAQWEANVTFDANGGNKIDMVSVLENHKLKKPIDPKKPFAEFMYWEKDGTAYDFNLPVKEDMTLKAKWKDYVLPQTKDMSIEKGQQFDFKEGIINRNDLPMGTKITLKNKIDTNTVGIKDVKIMVQYPNQDQKEVSYRLKVIKSVPMIDLVGSFEEKDIPAKMKYEADEMLDYNTQKQMYTPSVGKQKISHVGHVDNGKWVDDQLIVETIKQAKDGLTKVGNKEVSTNGDETITKIYEVNPDTGALTNPKVVKKVVVRLETISAKMKYEADENLEYNTKQKVSDPENGQKRITIISTLTNNQLVEGKPTEEIVKPAKDGLTKVGNKEVIKNGDITTMKIYKVDPNTGELSHPKIKVMKKMTELIPASENNHHSFDNNIKINKQIPKTADVNYLRFYLSLVSLICPLIIILYKIRDKVIH